MNSKKIIAFAEPSIILVWITCFEEIAQIAVYLILL
jgi:hypothetical protein